MDREALISASPVFGGLAATTTERLQRSLASRRFERGEPVYLRGAAAEAFYGVLAGRVRFSASAPDGKELVLDYAEAGRWFGEIGLFDDGPRVVDAIAAQDSELLVLRRRDLLELCGSDPELPLRLLALFSARIRTAEDIIADASFLSLPARMAKKLLMLADDPTRTEQRPDGVAVRIAQEELGRLSGVTRESAGKQLKSWERDGIVTIVYGRVVLHEIERLRRIVTAATTG
ncbi:MAG TPA: Crp/Fnr family transcriptional regulator [Candidatus Binatia bacterium]|nr:Crp/Fnr family transcriptional regulator [Candidatus Binatia bacterium]